MSHVTGYPARSRDRSCDRHTVTATRSPPHGHRHTVTATRSPPHGHRHTATATRPPSHGHRHTAQPPLAGSRAGSCDESCARLWWHLWPWELTRALGPRALSAALGPLAPTATPSLWPMATLSSWPTPFVNHGRWRPLSFGGPWRRGALGPWRPPTYGGLWPMGHPWPR